MARRAGRVIEKIIKKIKKYPSLSCFAIHPSYGGELVRDGNGAGSPPNVSA